MPLFFQQWRGEWLKLFARRRTYLGFAAFLALELVLLLVFRLQGVERLLERLIARQGQAFADYYSALTLGHMILGFSVLILGAIYLALVAGDIVAKEGEDGHFRLLLARPVSRVRLLALKYLSCLAYTVVLIQFIAWSAFALGVAVQGWGGGFFAMAPEVDLLVFHDWRTGLSRYALASLFLAAAMATVSSVAFFLSCFPIKPAAATIGALSYVLVDMILRNTGFMDDYDHLLLTKHMACWSRLLANEVPWAVVVRDYTVLAAVNASLFVLGTAVFTSRDLKS